MPVVARSKAWVYGLSLLELRFRIPQENRGLFLLIVVCCQVEVSAAGRKNAIACDASKFELEISTMKRSRPAGAVEPRKKNS
jgi:hypothetical protein